MLKCDIFRDKILLFVENNKKYFSKIMKILLQLIDINKIKKNKKYFKKSVARNGKVPIFAPVNERFLHRMEA